MRRSLAVVAVALSTFLLVGCTSSAGSDSTGTDVSVPSQEFPSGSTDEGGAPEIARDGVQGVAGDSAIEASNRDVITTGSVSLTVPDPLEAAEQAVVITERAGGRIDSRTESPETPNQPASANLSLRIPADQLNEALDELRDLGTVNHVSLNASDVTQQTQDLEARITSLRTSVDRLLALMAQATTTSDLIAIETALASRQAELESLQSQLEYLTDLVAFSTIELHLNAVGVVPPGSPDSFWAAILAGWNALLTALGGVVVGIGFAIPWLIALGLLAVIALVAYRLARRRRKGSDTPATPSQPSAPGTSGA